MFISVTLSFQVDHTYERNFLIKYIVGLQSDLKLLVRPHLTDKSLDRIDHVLDFLAQPEFLDALYVPGRNPEVATQMGVLMELLSRCMEEGVL